MDPFPLKFHAFISHKTPKYLQNFRFSRKLHHDSPIDGTKTSNLHRPIELDELYRMDPFVLKFHAFISHKTAKYLQNPRFSRKLHHDSPIEGTKISNLHRPIELDELYRMDPFLLKFHACISHKTPKYLQNPRFSRKLYHDSPLEGTKTSNLHRPIELDELYRMDPFLLKFHACISHKTPKYLQNPRFSRKLYHDSPLEGTKTSNLYRPIELD